ncbi:MAG: CotH kinase family protein [Paludibacter sp.]|nr:CotH kinase family protein [Paludibacter sp.]
MQLYFKFIFTALSLVFFSFTIKSESHWETAIFNTDTWRYFVGTTEPPTDWRSSTFDDSSWLSGKGGIGNGDNDDNTIIEVCTSVFLRISFNVTDTTVLSSALLNIDYDDAFVAYLNGIEIARVGITGNYPTYNTLGTNHEAQMYSGGTPESFSINKKLLSKCILKGKNVLSVQVHNSSETSSDMSSNVFLSFLINNSTTYYRSTPAWFKAPFVFDSSNLPVINITTDFGATIVDEPKVNAIMTIFNDSVRNYLLTSKPDFVCNIGIEYRGSYSQNFPQKSYGLETRDSIGNNFNTKVLGMPKENDWILTANYNDKVFARNSFAFDLFKQMGHYAPRLKHCEVIVNDEYQGIFLFSEKIKQDDDRVNIADITTSDSTGNNVTGGYIFKTDYTETGNNWLSSYSPVNKPGSSVYFVYHDPKPEDITEPQKEYLKDYIYGLETVLYSDDFANPSTGFRAYLDEASFIDYFIIGEITRNPDAYKKSRYFYKDRDSIDSKVYSGPVWDYDWAYKNINTTCVHSNSTDGSGWSYLLNECNPRPVPPSWEVRMLQDTVFANAINARYYELRNSIMSDSRNNHFIDSIATLLAEAQARHYTKWSTLGLNVGTNELGTQPTTFEGEIQKFKNWIQTRMNWLDTNMVGHRIINTANINLKQTVFRIFPNPVTSTLYVESDKNIQSVEIYDLSGQQIRSLKVGNSSKISIDVDNLNRGEYLVTVKLTNNEMLTQKLIKN